MVHFFLSYYLSYKFFQSFSNFHNSQQAGLAGAEEWWNKICFSKKLKVSLIKLLYFQPVFSKTAHILDQKMSNMIKSKKGSWSRTTNKNLFFLDQCFVRKWRLKFQVSKYGLRWNAENMKSSVMSPPKITQLPFLRTFYDRKSTNLLSGDESLNYLHVHHKIIFSYHHFFL